MAAPQPGAELVPYSNTTRPTSFNGQINQFLTSFKDYPQRQKAASFNMDEVLAKLKEASK